MKADHAPIIPHGKAPHDHSHKMHHEHVKQHAAGHVHHSDHYGKHAAGHKMHHDHVKSMCGGGYAKGK